MEDGGLSCLDYGGKKRSEVFVPLQKNPHLSYKKVPKTPQLLCNKLPNKHSLLTPTIQNYTYTIIS